MARLVRMQDFEVSVDMSPEFAAQLDVPLRILLALIDLDQPAGQIFKFGLRRWSARPDWSGSAVFIAGWDTLDERHVIEGSIVRVRKVYLASSVHSAKRARAANGLELQFPLLKR